MWRRAGLEVSALDFRSEGRLIEPGLRGRVLSLGKKLHFTLSLSAQMFKWIPAIIILSGGGRGGGGDGDG